jgi:hypothetical protein
MKLVIIYDESVPEEYLNALSKFKLYFDSIETYKRPEFEFIYMTEEEDNFHPQKMKEERRIHYPKVMINHILLQKYEGGLGINQNRAREVLFNYLKYENKMGVYAVYITKYPLLQDVYTYYKKLVKKNYGVAKQQHYLQTYGLFSMRYVFISTDGLTSDQFSKVYIHEWIHMFIKGHCDNSSTVTHYNCLMSRLGHPTDIDLANGLCEEHVTQMEDLIDMSETIF